ncbi:hypothetical protein H2199_001140 [Coniosporium tulheliwenetii]|uniref:Uncharacterized protein n=1 Tax=Coniosporium tulheliwenetii TaxID=3383036 RepID=A0ACC2ZL05_9PEZI|nr:hypothetical protein H2199_001140 [Cladosporium sp. JES 115]
MSRAAWHGTRIILRQVSPESLGIFDFILELYACCSGDWDGFVGKCGFAAAELDVFLEYAATFLSDVGNYYGSGDQKFVPNVSPDFLKKLASNSPKLERLYNEIAEPIVSTPPFSLGYPGDLAQSSYYPGSCIICKEEIALVSQALEARSIFPENTRIRKAKSGETPVFEVLQASVEKDEHAQEFPLPDSRGVIRLVRGDHSEELSLICSSLTEASKYAANETQRTFISQYIESFRTGSLHVYRDSQRTWITDKTPRVENIFGFVEPYRDPHGSRAEFEGLVAISDTEETKTLTRLVEHSARFIRRLPWADRNSIENNGKGPFEKALFEPPDFTSIHALAYCSSIIFPGINLPNYNDIRQDCGFKNVIIANRMSAESDKAELCPFLDESEAETFQRHKYPAYYWWVVLHELLGHGTGKMMVQESEEKFNFEINNPPLNPSPETQSRLGTDLGKLGRLVGAYLMDDKELLALFGFTEESEITAEDLTYNTYLQLGVDGLRGLQNFNIDDGKWGQAHSRAHFATLKCLLTDGGGFMTIEKNPAEQKLSVRVDRSKIATHGKPALGRMLLRLHMYRCTADVQACRFYYEELSRVDGEYLEWREIVLAKNEPKPVFVQANTFLEGDEVVLKEYEPTKEGVIQSWAERAV